jgi:D-beta-D-heptose 7-phosphate kinase/D-beta-D-heptose 1-phosphate adenosyltransferase
MGLNPHIKDGNYMCYERVVVVNGCFDILHTGHLNLLQRARELGDYVVVLVDTDSRVTANKGIGRPINNHYERMRMLMELRCVDAVETFDTDEELEILYKSIQPYYMVKGEDYRGKIAIGQQWCKNIEYVELNGKSTTSITNR